jgi:hypothetical protein
MTELELRQRLLQKLQMFNLQQLLFLEKLILSIESCFPYTKQSDRSVQTSTLVVSPATNPYPLRGLPIQYIDPTEPVALEDWEILS